MNRFAERNCPICGMDPRGGKVAVKAGSPAEELSADELRSVFIGLRNDQVFFTYYRCEDCQLLWCPTYFSDEFLESLYQSMPPNNRIYGEKSSERTQRNYVDWIDLDSWRKSDYVLELGSDVGNLLNEIAKRRDDLRLIAVEPNRTVHPILRETLGCQSMVLANADEIPANLEIDHLIAIHVLDHLTDPSIVLRAIREKMSQIGTIHAVVHDEKSVLKKLLGKRWPPYCLQHPQIYSSDTIEQLFRKVGFSRCSVSKTKNVVNVRELAKSTLLILGMDSRLSWALPNFELQMKLGNIICTAFRDVSV